MDGGVTGIALVALRLGEFSPAGELAHAAALSTRLATVAGAAFGNLPCLPFAPPLLRIAVALPADLAIPPGAGIDLALVSIAALRSLFPAATVLGMTDLTQVGGLNAVRDIADVVNIQLRVVAADEDNKRGDVGPRPARNLLVHASLVTVPTHDEAAVFHAY